MKWYEGHCITVLQNIKPSGIYFKMAQEHISSRTFHTQKRKNSLLDFKQLVSIFNIKTIKLNI